MKKTAIIFSLLVFSMLGISAQDNGSNNKTRIITQERDVDNFDKIEVRGRFEVKLTQQENTAVSVAAQESYLDFIETYVENGTLIVQMKDAEKDKGFFDKFKSKYSDYMKVQRFEVNIGVKDLKSVKLSGALALKTQNTFNLEDIYFDISGASKVMMTCALHNLTADISGASSVTFSGTAENTSVAVSGASALKMGELKSNTAIALVSGASSATVYASEKFTGKASGASAIHCYGNPKNVDRDVSGASKINMK